MQGEKVILIKSLLTNKIFTKSNTKFIHKCSPISTNLKINLIYNVENLLTHQAHLNIHRVPLYQFTNSQIVYHQIAALWTRIYLFIYFKCLNQY